MFFSVQVCLAGTGAITVRPPRPQAAAAGLRMTVDSRWVTAMGYRPVHVRLAADPPAPAPVERVLTVEITLSYGGHRTIQNVIIPRGAALGEATIVIPQEVRTDSIRIQVFEGGEPIKRLEVSVPIGGTWNGYARGMLFIDSDAPSRPGGRGAAAQGDGELPDARALASDNNGAAVNDLAAGNSPQAVRNLRLSFLTIHSDMLLLPPSELPESPLPYVSMRRVFISLGDLALLQKQHPQQWSALRKAVLAGLTLVVYGADKPQIPELAARLEMVPDDSAWRIADPAAFDFTARVADERKQRGYDDYDYYDNDDSGYYYGASGATIATEPPPGSSMLPLAGNTPQASFSVRGFGRGAVVALADAMPFPSDESEWAWIFHSADDATWDNYLERANISPVGDECYFYFDNSIPGVGAPPVMLFAALVTLFCLVAGPISYFILRNMRRLYLILITTPLFAGVITLAVFGYAAVKDGFHSRSRTFSVTSINQRDGHAVTVMRQTHFAGVMGLPDAAYPADCMVCPLERPRLAGEARPEKELHWEEDRQVWKGKFIRSRDPVQLAVWWPRHEPDLGLKIKENTDGTLLIANRLRTRIVSLVIRDSQGRWFSARDVEANGTFSPDSADRQAFLSVGKAVARKIPRSRANEFLPNVNGPFPPGYYGYESEVPEAEASEAAHEFFHSRTMSPRSYVAIVDSPSNMPGAVPGAEEVEPFHVVVGTW